MKLFLSVVIAIVLAGCINEKTDDSLKLELSRSIRFALDESVSKESNTMQFITEGKNQFLAILNSPTHEIVYLDYDSGKISRKIQLAKDGPDGVGTPFGFQVKSKDSVFVLSSRSYLLSLVDQQGKVFKRYRLLDGEIDKHGIPKTDYSSQPLLQSTAPLLIFNDSLAAIAAVPDKDPTRDDFYEGSFAYIVLNLKSGTFDYNFPYPEQYHGSVWSFYHQFPFHTYNTRKKQAIVSFPLVRTLFETDFISKQSHDYQAEEPGVPEPWSNPQVTPLPIVKEFMQSPSYYRIIYDETRDVYYRFFQKPTEIDYSEVDLQIFSPFKEKDTFIAVLDSEFRKVGEVQLPEYLDPRFVFINQNGLHIAYDNNNEDVLEFKICSFIAD